MSSHRGSAPSGSPLARIMAGIILIILCVGVGMWGIDLRTPSTPQAPKEAKATDPAGPTDLSIAPRANPALPPVSPDPLVLQPGATVVSLTFDDGRASDALAAGMMNTHGLAGTFFLNSGNIGKPGYLSLSDVDRMATSGHEIGGHTVTHRDLEKLSGDEVRREICDDRATLVDWGFPVRSFAYPFASATPELESVVAGCGYNSARSLGELRTNRLPEGVPPELSCQLCDSAETVPPSDPMYTKAPAQVRSDWTISDLQQQVTDAQAVGGWLQLTFHGICPGDCSDITTSGPEFEDFLAWLETQQAQGTVLVRTVGDVIGGPVQPSTAGPVAPPAPTGTNAVVNPNLEEQNGGVPSCWTQAAYGNNSPEFSLIPNAHNGTTANRLVMRDYVDGGAQLLQSTDLGMCAPTVVPRRTYTLAAWYTSTVPASFSVQYRLAHGAWVYARSSPQFAPAADFTQARWALPPIPEGVSAISFGLTIAQDGELVTGDYSLNDDTGSPP